MEVIKKIKFLSEEREEKKDMIIVLTILVAIIAIYAMILETRIKALEADVKTLFEVNNLTAHMLDVLHDQLGIVAEKVGIKEGD